MIIQYKGETIDTKHFSNITDNECQALREAFYEKPSIDKVEKNLKTVFKGGVSVSDITNYYFKDLMAKVKLHHCKWSLEELFECNDLIRFVHGKTLHNKKVFPDSNSEIQKIETAIRLSGKGSAAKPTNFPMKAIDNILDNYNINNVYYDFSCGWGIRMLSAMKKHVTYLGTDPNYLLTERLLELHDKFDKVNSTKTEVDIRTQGSEEFIPEWENTVGVAFSSPPYFGLEDYKVGNQSYAEGMQYEDWLNGYYTNTIKNIHKYLISEGKLLINISDYGSFTLVEDTKRICAENGFEYVGADSLQNIKRITCTKALHEGKEDILIFKKKH